MSFDWSQYLNLAQKLAGQEVTAPGREAELRCAISRAYYAVFCSAKNHLRDREHLSIPRARVHSYVIDQFKDSPDSARIQLGQDLDRLRWDRNKADYDDDFPKFDDTATLDMRLAQQLLTALAKL